jgi:hypothetical protein
MKVFPAGQAPKDVAFTQHLGDFTDLDVPTGEVTRHDGYVRLPCPVVPTCPAETIGHITG